MCRLKLMVSPVVLTGNGVVGQIDGAGQRVLDTGEGFYPTFKEAGATTVAFIRLLAFITHALRITIQ